MTPSLVTRRGPVNAKPLPPDRVEEAAIGQRRGTAVSPPDRAGGTVIRRIQRIVSYSLPARRIRRQHTARRRVEAASRGAVQP